MRRTPIGHCWHGITGLLCWMLWLILGAALALQIFLLVGRNIELPDFARNQLRKAIAAQGLDLNFKTATLDPGGVIVLDHVSLADARISEPLLTARSLLIRVDPGWLITRRSDLRVEATGVNLLLPAVVSPSGVAEPLVENAQFSVRLSGRHIDIHGLSARLGGVTLTASGTLDLDAPAEPPSGQLSTAALRRLLTGAIPAARHFVTFTSKFRATGDLVTHLALDHRTLILTALMPEAHYADPIPALPALQGIHARKVLARVTLPLDPTTPGTPPILAATLTMDTLDLAGLGSGTGVTIDATAPSLLQHLSAAIPHPNQQPTTAYPLEQIKINASVDHITSHGAEAHSARLTLRPLSGGHLHATLAARWLDTTWSTQYDGRMDALDGVTATQGTLTPETLDALSRIVQKPLNRLLQLTHPALLTARVQITPGGLIGPATGYLHARDVIAGNVPFNLATGHFIWDGVRSLVAYNITLQQDDSTARGSYTMDAQTLDFRFLLTGHLRPPAISGWFGDWWQDFWGDFGFGPIPAAADVDVGGNWRDPHSVHVMVGVAGDVVNLRGVDLDRLHTRIFIRPTWYDILDFHGERAGYTATGRFDLRLPSIGEPWETMHFDVQSTLPLPLVGALLGSEATSQLAVLKFETPPRLHATGHIHQPPAANQQPATNQQPTTAATYQLTLEADATGPFTVHDFPLRDLSLAASINDATINLPRLRLGLAGGTLEGPATLTGPPGRRHLAIDQHLRDADLAEFVLTINQAIQRAKPPDATVPPPPPPPLPSSG